MIEHMNYEYNEDTLCYRNKLDNVRLEYHGNYRRLVKEQFCMLNDIEDFDDISVSFLRKSNYDDGELDFQIRTYLVRWNDWVYIARVHISNYCEQVTMYIWEL